MGNGAQQGQRRSRFARAIEAGYHHATHLYNVMTGLHHRRPGIVGGFLTHDGTTCELICDGLHVHPWALDIAIRCKGPDRIAMITDLSLAGAPEGDYPAGTVFPGVEIVVKDGIARVKGSNPMQDNTMAGSTMLQNVGVRNVLKLGYSLPIAFRMASLTPARIMDVDKQKGSLENHQGCGYHRHRRRYQRQGSLCQRRTALSGGRAINTLEAMRSARRTMARRANCPFTKAALCDILQKTAPKEIASATCSGTSQQTTITSTTALPALPQRYG